MDWAKVITWEVTVAIVAVVAAICALVIFGHVDLKDIATFGTTIIGALVLAQLKVTREQASRIEANSNGTLKALQEKLDAANKTISQMAAQLPPNAQLPKALTDEEQHDT